MKIKNYIKMGCVFMSALIIVSGCSSVKQELSPNSDVSFSGNSEKQSTKESQSIETLQNAIDDFSETLPLDVKDKISDDYQEMKRRHSVASYIGAGTDTVNATLASRDVKIAVALPEPSGWEITLITRETNGNHTNLGVYGGGNFKPIVLRTWFGNWVIDLFAGFFNWIHNILGVEEQWHYFDRGSLTQNNFQFTDYNAPAGENKYTASFFWFLGEHKTATSHTLIIRPEILDAWGNVVPTYDVKHTGERVTYTTRDKVSWDLKEFLYSYNGYYKKPMVNNVVSNNMSISFDIIATGNISLTAALKENTNITDNIIIHFTN